MSGKSAECQPTCKALYYIFSFVSMQIAKMFVWTSILLLQGTIASFAYGCGLEDICRDGGIISRSKILNTEFMLE